MQRIMKTTMVLVVALMLLVLSAVPVLAQSASAGGATDPYSSETVTVTLDLTIMNEVPEGRTFGLGYQPIGNLLDNFKGVGFCTTDSTNTEGLPQCEAGGTYSGTLEVPVGVPFSYDFMYDANADVVRCDYIGPTEIFHSDTQTFTEDTSVSASYTEDGLPVGCDALDDDPGDDPGDKGPSEQYEDPDQYEDPSSPDPVDNSGLDNGGDSSDNGLDVLPDTGGAAFWTLGAGLLLVGAGLSAWRLTRG